MTGNFGIGGSILDMGKVALETTTSYRSSVSGVLRGLKIKGMGKFYSSPDRLFRPDGTGIYYLSGSMGTTIRCANSIQIDSDGEVRCGNGVVFSSGGAYTCPDMVSYSSFSSITPSSTEGMLCLEKRLSCLSATTQCLLLEEQSPPTPGFHRPEEEVQ